MTEVPPIVRPPASEPGRAAKAPDMARRVPHLPSLLAEVSRSPSFLALAIRAGLVEELDGTDVFTVFVPDERAFARLGSARASLSAGPVELAFEVAEHHLVRGWAEVGVHTTLQGETLTVDLDRVGDARRRGAPILCRNGLIVPIGAVLVPRWGKAAPAVARIRHFLEEAPSDTLLTA